MKLCDWVNIDKNISELVEKIKRGEKATHSFPALAFTTSAELQRKIAEILARDKYPANNVLGPIHKRSPSGKIKIGYYSADFQNHATAYLMAELFEQHDKNKFELIAFSFGPNYQSDMRQRIVRAFDQFIDVKTKSDEEVAKLSRDLGIDIAVDLKGFTQGDRLGIFSFRAAPIQVHYLGYPGTTGTEYIDYLIADKILIPETNQQYYSEKIAYLPNCYQVNDTQREIAGRNFTSAELGLPEAGFVFCCFNRSYKITPSMFDCWVSILNRVEGSVLWLFEENPIAVNNLRQEAEKRGLDQHRLIFAEKMKMPEHLARHKLADLFLDTFPCNAHTTTSDALWAGLPVLTLAGETFASRVAASLLNAIGLPELITTTLTDYEALAVELVTHPDKLKAIKTKLAANRLTTPLFNTALFAGHIENAYTQMFDRYQADLTPDTIYVPE